MVAVLAFGVGRADSLPKKESAWLTDFASAQQAARSSGKPIFAVLH
jgi:hypothetical protein